MSSRNRGSGSTVGWQAPNLALQGGSHALVSSWTQGARRLLLNLQNPSTVAVLPSACAVFSSSIKDIRGLAVPLLSLWDTQRTLIQPQLVTPHVGLVLWAGFSIGQVNATNRGWAVGLIGQSGGWEVNRTHNVGSGWAAAAPGSAISASTAQAEGRCGIATVSSSGSIQGFGRSSTGAIITTANVPTTLQTAASLNGEFDTFFVGVGFTGAGSAPAADYQAGYGHFVAVQEAITGALPLG